MKINSRKNTMTGCHKTRPSELVPPSEGPQRPVSSEGKAKEGMLKETSSS